MLRTDLLEAVKDGPVSAYGLTPAFCAWLAASLAERRTSSGPVVVVVADEHTARQMTRDIAFFSAAATDDNPAAAPPALHIPALDTSPYAELSPDRDALARRMSGLFRATMGGPLLSSTLVVSAASLLRRVIPQTEFETLVATLETGQELNRDDTAELLVRAGYSRIGVVDDRGTFAVRGGVLDVFPPLYTYPIRIDLFGDEIESLRSFDPDTQRTLRSLDRIYLHPVRETIATTGSDPKKHILSAADSAAHPSRETNRIVESALAGEIFVGMEILTPAFHREMAPLASYFGAVDTWLVVDPEAIGRAAEDELAEAEARHLERVGDHKISFAPNEHYISLDDFNATLTASPHRIAARSLEVVGQNGEGRSMRVDIDGNQGIRSALERARRTQGGELMRPLIDALAEWARTSWRIAIACESGTRADKLRGALGQYDVRLETTSNRRLDELKLGVPTIVPGSLSTGFSIPGEQIALLTEDDIFGQRRHSTIRQKRAAKRARAALLGGVDDFSQLEPGNFLVHDLHGVGAYRGLVKLPHRDLDFLHIEYRGGVLYLPVYRMGEVQRYIGAEGHKPRLDKLGGSTWATTRKRVAVAVRALAEELLQLYAQRASLPGHSFPASDAMFAEFEATFEFDETPDQQRAIDEVIADMEGPRPMDRLVCGDVGYGKTEVALRAMLKAVIGGKQAAMLAPTTVLVEQHYQNMVKRFSGWPVTVARLSRFQSRKEQLATVKGLAEGTIDAVVGTHRLLSKDVRFKDLGLLIIDEEQRFGVTHKERLKRMRTQLDALTLTATPIPRTLHLAMTGLRDLSIIATPPADRRSIRTFVARPDEGVLREGLKRELGRGGQVFFVAPRIGDKRASRQRSLEEWADYLGGLVPTARIAVAHGQMSSDKLERVMVGFVDGEFDILISTTIIESGLDIPRANTMFVAEADRFGLAQLYQLRGRIGRSKERAFCYLLVPPPSKLTASARRRLETLQRFSELGAGFAIASQDLEIRGAGELLGAKQSGSIAAVGFDAYTRLLEEAVAELRGEEIGRADDPELNVDVAGFIPDDFVPDTGQRLDLYKRLSMAEDGDEVADLMAEISDRYGVPPPEVHVLGDLMVLKSLARRFGAVSVELTDKRLVLALSERTPIAPEALLGLVSRDQQKYRLTPDMRLSVGLVGSPDTGPLSSARGALLDLLACAT